MARVTPSEIKADPTAIGEVSEPPFAVLPKPDAIFAARAKRLRTYAQVSPMKPYLEFVAAVTDAQLTIIPGLPIVAMRDADDAAQAATFGLPQIDRARITVDDALTTTLDRLFDNLSSIDMPVPAAEALERVAHCDITQRERMVRDVLDNALSLDELAEHSYIAAGLQVHLVRLASQLDATTLVPVGDGVCPSCGGAPVASVIVEWVNAHGSRFCVCSLCATLWYYVRVRCCSCGTTKGIGYQEIEGGNGTIKAETCDECRTYVKVMYQNKDLTIDPVADDIGTLALDMLMSKGPYRRAAFNPFLLSY